MIRQGTVFATAQQPLDWPNWIFIALLTLRPLFAPMGKRVEKEQKGFSREREFKLKVTQFPSPLEVAILTPALWSKRDER